MKKRVIISICLIVCFSYANSQIAIGPKSGINFSTETFKMQYEQDEKDAKKVPAIGYIFGGIFNVKINKLITVQPEILFIQKGARINSTIDTYYSQITTNYLSGSLLTKFTHDYQSTTLFLDIGPYYGYWMDAKVKIRCEEKIMKFEYSFNDEPTKQVSADNRFDFGLSLGGGISHNLGIGDVFFDIHYIHGFSDLRKYEGAPYYSRLSNRSLAFSFGYLIYLTKS